MLQFKLITRRPKVPIYSLLYAMIKCVLLSIGRKSKMYGFQGKGLLVSTYPLPTLISLVLNCEQFHSHPIL